MRRNLGYFVLGVALATSGLYAVAVGDMVAFKAGDPIKSAEVNANFTTLKSAVVALETPLGSERLANGAVTLPKLAISGSAADGKVLKLEGGSLAWADDLAGSGGSSYSADGTSLTLSGTTFSLKDGGVSTAKLAEGAVSQAKLADGSVNSNKLAANAVSGSKIADGTVTAADLAFPLSVNGGFGFTGLSVNNSTSTGGAIGIRGQSGGGAAIAVNTPVGVLGESPSGFGVIGASNSSAGVQGSSSSGDGVRGLSSSLSGVFGQSNSGPGVQGWSNSAPALVGQNNGSAETLKLVQQGSGALIDARGFGGVTVFSVDSKGNVYSATNSYTSDRNAKTNFQRVNSLDVLDRVAAMPVTRWNYKHDPSSVQHIGPMAQDFHAAFGLNGSDNTHINAVDVQGVALAAIQGLYRQNQELEAKNKNLETRLIALEAYISSIKRRQVRSAPALSLACQEATPEAYMGGVLKAICTDSGQALRSIAEVGHEPGNHIRPPKPLGRPSP